MKIKQNQLTIVSEMDIVYPIRLNGCPYEKLEWKSHSIFSDLSFTIQPSCKRNKSNAFILKHIQS